MMSIISKRIQPVRFLLAPLIVSFLISGCGGALTDAEYLARAKEYKNKGQSDASIVDLKNALQANPDNIEARWLLGEIYTDIGLAAEAEKELRRAGEMGIVPEAVSLPLAKALLMQGKYQEVLDIDTNNLAADSEPRAKLIAMQGHSHLGLGNPDKAGEAYQSALSINADEPEASLGMARLAIKDQELENARALLDKTLKMDPALVEAWSLLGNLEQHEGDIEKAESHYGNAIMHREWNIADRFNRALMRILLEKYDEANKDIAQIRRMYKNFPGADFAQGLIQFQQGKYSEAQISFENAVSGNSNYMQAVFYLGVVHYLEGHDEQARTYLNKFSTAFPANVSAQQLLAILDLRSNQYDSARQRLEQAQQRQPDNVLTFKLMADLAMQQGYTTEAIENMRKVSMLEKGSSEAHLRLGLGLMAEGDTELSRLELKKAIELEPRLAGAEIALVLSYLHEDKVSQAVETARKLVEKEPESPMALNLLGATYIRNQQKEEARTAFERALKLVPGEPGAAHNLAVMAQQEGDIQHAIALYRDVLRYNPGHQRTTVKLAALLINLGQDNEASELLEKSIEQHPDAIEPRLILAKYYMKQNQPEMVLTVLRPVEEKPHFQSEMLFILGEARLETGDASGAARALKRLVEVEPKSVNGHYLLAMSYHRQDKLVEMKEELGKALRVNPHHLPSQLALVGLLVQQNDIKNAVALLNELERLNPQIPAIHMEKAKLAMLQKRADVAEEAYQKVLELSPSSDVIAKLALVQWGSGQHEASLKTMQDWVVDHPSDWLAKYNLANLYQLAGKEDKARQAFIDVIAVKPDNAMAHNNLAWLLRDIDPREAQVNSERALQLAPDSPIIQHTHAMILLEQGQTKQAVRLLEKASTHKSRNPTINYHWAMALSRSGEDVRAREVLKALLEQEPTFPEEQEARELLTKLGGG